MQRIYFLFCFVIVFLISTIIHAQAPQGIPYQAVARDVANGTVMANKTIDVKFKITTGVSGSIVDYEENFAGTTTNNFGLFALTIGQGTVVQGTFSGINWALGNKWLSVYIDTTASGNYGSPISQTQFMSVPYALYAKSAGSSTSTATNLPIGTNQQTLFYNGSANKWRSTNDLLIDTSSQTIIVNGAAKIHSLNINNNYTLPLGAGNNGDVLTFGTGGTTSWLPIPGAAKTSWLLTGNASTNPGVAASQNFIGSTDNKDLILATNSKDRIHISANGNIGINNSTPTRTLDVISPDQQVASFKSTSPRTVFEIQNTTLGSALKFNHNNTDSSFVGYEVFTKQFYMNNFDVPKGKILLKTRQKVDIIADSLIANNNNSAIGIKALIKGILIPDSLKLPGVGSANTGWVLSNAGNGNVVWTNPSTFGDNLGNHALTQKLITKDNWITNDGSLNGIFLKQGGNVGIGTNIPTSTLTVNGDVEIPSNNDYKYTTPKLHYYTIDPTAFVETNVSQNLSSIQYNGVQADAVFFPGGVITGTPVHIAAPVNFPDGAVITNVTMEYVDNDNNDDLSLKVYRSKINTGSTNPITDVLGTVVSSFNPTSDKIQSASTVINTNNLVDNGTYTYRVGITFDTKGLALNKLSVTRVRMTYTVLTAD